MKQLCEKHQERFRYKICPECHKGLDNLSDQSTEEEAIKTLKHAMCRYRVVTFVKDCLFNCKECQAINLRGMKQ